MSKPRSVYTSNVRNDGLTPGQERAIRTMLTARSIAAAARQANVGQSTLRRWLREDDNFQNKLRQLREEALAHAALILQQAAAEAAFLIRHYVQSDEPLDWGRVMILRTAIEYGFRSAVYLDIVDRVKALEKAQQRREANRKPPTPPATDPLLRSGADNEGTAPDPKQTAPQAKQSASRPKQKTRSPRAKFLKPAHNCSKPAINQAPKFLKPAHKCSFPAKTTLVAAKTTDLAHGFAGPHGSDVAPRASGARSGENLLSSTSPAGRIAPVRQPKHHKNSPNHRNPIHRPQQFDIRALCKELNRRGLARWRTLGF